ncbi:Sister chromatid cohesion protein DCC1 [Mortierella sp. NVP85]|nr:Sister chromatid cohesion protein DCC1 [Mortierella sp. NVP85]
MANPSTQPPSNAKTTDIIFPRNFVQSSYVLLEVPKCLESYIDRVGEDGELSFQVRGTEKDTAVLCTLTQTFNLQRAHTSNMLLPVAPVISQRSHDMDMDADLDMAMDSDFNTEADPYDIHGPQSDESPYEKQAILDMLDSVLDLSLIPPRLERLSELLGRSQFEGWNQESQVKGHLYTWNQLQSVIQASDTEILQWLKDRHACLIKGHWRLFKRRFMYDILQDILMTLNVLEMSTDAVHGATLCNMIEEEAPGKESGIETWMVEHCLKSFSDDEQSTEPGYYHLSGKKLCTFMGGNRWKLEDFVYAWEKSLHGHYQTDLACLAGECVVEADRAPDRNQTIRYIRYFSKSHLPIDPATRFTALFEIKNKWEAQEIRPFLRDLVLDDKKLDVMLIKHARSTKQPNGEVIYSSRIIK